MGFLRTIFVILIIWYCLKLIFRWLLPFLLNKTVQKAQQDFKQPPYTQQPNPSETLYKSKKVVGEYIDFEEVKD